MNPGKINFPVASIVSVPGGTGRSLPIVVTFDPQHISRPYNEYPELRFHRHESIDPYQ